jgi:hypothetical protein
MLKEFIQGAKDIGRKMTFEVVMISGTLVGLTAMTVPVFISIHKLDTSVSQFGQSMNQYTADYAAYMREHSAYMAETGSIIGDLSPSRPDSPTASADTLTH